MKFFDIAEYESDLKAVSIIIGGRGIGKTYSALDYLIRTKKRFLYMRNTRQQIAECCSDFGNPFKRLNKDKGYDIQLVPQKEHINIVNGDLEVIGYASPLSVFENLRGIDLSDVDYVLFDEFIETRKLTFDQFKAFVNMRETVGRNRELFGEAPLICILLSNSQSLNNPILAGYDLIPDIEGMLKTHQQKMKRKNMFVLLPESEISELKKKTSTYEGISNSRIYKENIENKFANDSFYGIKRRNIREYAPLCKIDDMFIYRHKSSGKLYVCSINAMNIPEYSSKDNALAFYQAYGRYMPLAYAHGEIDFSDFTIKSKFMKVIE